MTTIKLYLIEWDNEKHKVIAFLPDSYAHLIAFPLPVLRHMEEILCQEKQNFAFFCTKCALTQLQYCSGDPRITFRDGVIGFYKSSLENGEDYQFIILFGDKNDLEILYEVFNKSDVFDCTNFETIINPLPEQLYYYYPAARQLKKIPMDAIGSFN